MGSEQVIKIKPKVQLAIAIIVALVLVAVAFGGIYLTRTPDSEYKKAAEQLSSLQEATEDIKRELAATPQAAAIDMTTLENLRNAYANVRKFSDFSSTVIVKNKTINNTYEQNSNTLKAYDDQAKKLLSAISAYTDTVEICQKFTSSIAATATKPAIDTASAACRDSIKKIRELPTSGFTESFLYSYADELDNYIKTLVAYTSSNSTTEKRNYASTLSISYNKIIEIGDSEIDYDLTEIPSSFYDSIRDSLTKQQGEFLR